MTPHDLNVDLERNIAHAAGQSIPLTPTEAEFLHVLTRGGVARYGHMISQIWGANEPNWAKNTIKFYAVQLRKKLAGLGFKIITHRGAGFDLVRDRPPARAGLLSELA